MSYYNSVVDIIGKTPLLCLNRLGEALKLEGHLFSKMEMMNPAGSAKDRVAREMIHEARKKGTLKEGSVIIEPTSGNTGIGIAMVALAEGYKTILCMPETMSKERMELLKAYGAKLVLTPGKEGMDGSVKKAKQLNEEIKDSVILGQFDNSVNARAHYKTTGPEIYEDLDGHVDVFIAGVGTGGTLTGVSHYLKEKNKKIEIVAVEPDDSPLISKGVSGPHKLQGIGANFIPKVFDMNCFDYVMTRTTEQAYEGARLLKEYEGVLAGITGGAVISAGVSLLQSGKYKNKNIVVLLPDTGERYLSTELYK